MTSATHDLTLALWRDPDPDVLGLPGVAMRPRPAAGDPCEVAAKLYHDGARRVALSRPVDLTGQTDHRTLVWTMLLLRDLTSWGMVVDWQLRPGEFAPIWQRLKHLYPPADILDQPDSSEVLANWRETFYICKCIYRRGPGFVEVRDRRAELLARFVIDEPEYLAAIEKLTGGTTVDQVPDRVLADFLAEGLVGTVDDLAWWVPYRIRRWPWPAIIV